MDRRARIATVVPAALALLCGCGSDPVAPRAARPDVEDAAIDAPIDVAPEDVSPSRDAADAAETLRCALGQTFCGAACVDPRADPAHCGRCDRACAAGEVCLSGACAPRCEPTETRCDGRCVDARTDRSHCGACARACAAAEVCSDGECVPDCGASLARCAGGDGDGGVARYCADLRSERANCGACGAVCGAGLACMEGRCLAVCAATEARCGDTCHDLRADLAHCGACGVACAGEERCLAGRCRVPCGPGFGDCDGACVDLARDARHCGACGVRCRLPHASAARCDAGRCAPGACEDGFADCNGEPADGCEVDTRADASHCGACARACALPGAAAACVAGVCGVAACAPGRADCDGAPANGCEVDTLSDAANCGGCSAGSSPRACSTGQVCSAGACRATCAGAEVLCSGRCIDVSADPANCGACRAACSLANASAVCVARACRVSACRAGFADCDRNAANGCETAVGAADRANCGACGRVCVLPNAAGACAAGACVPGACAAGWGDCDGVASNGCEARLAIDGAHCGACGRRCAAGSVCAAGACVAACAAGATDCGGSCRDTSTDTAACGACGEACAPAPHAFARCLGGACGVTCQASWGNCDGVAANGCERPLDTLSDCGACARACSLANAASACTAAGACVVASCVAGFANCDGVAANGCEVYLDTDPARCGACSGRACAAGQLCEGGACVASCGASRLRCGGACVDTDRDARNCGSCGVACVDRPDARGVCEAGRCGLVCAGSRADCNGDPDDGCEADLTTERNCGSCGRSCGVGTRCLEGACRVPPGYHSAASAGPVPFVDACAASGSTRVTFARADDAEQALSLPFEFPFWGEARAAGSALTVSTSGYVRFGAGDGALSGIIPSPGLPNGVIAAHWADLSARDPQLCVAVVGAAPARRLAIEWPDATYYDRSPGARLAFEVVLHETTGIIEIVFRAATGARAGTTGVESLDGRAGVRPSIELHRGCVDARGSNCTPEAAEVYRFVPGGDP